VEDDGGDFSIVRMWFTLKGLLDRFVILLAIGRHVMKLLNLDVGRGRLGHMAPIIDTLIIKLVGVARLCQEGGFRLIDVFLYMTLLNNKIKK
jgi:hypothetical protein